jgi:hypothetical protein
MGNSLCVRPRVTPRRVESCDAIMTVTDAWGCEPQSSDARQMPVSGMFPPPSPSKFSRSSDVVLRDNRCCDPDPANAVGPKPAYYVIALDADNRWWMAQSVDASNRTWSHIHGAS